MKGFLERIAFRSEQEEIDCRGKILAIKDEEKMELVRAEWGEPISGDSIEDIIEKAWRAGHFETVIIVHYYYRKPIGLLNKRREKRKLKAA